MTVSNQVRECDILAGYARNTKATAEGDLIYWTGQTDATTLRARSEIVRASESIVACDLAISELERSRDAAVGGLDVTDSLRSARKTLDRLVNCHVRRQFETLGKRSVRAHSSTSSA
jgi:fructose-specific phosphotransferase system component IIB